MSSVRCIALLLFALWLLLSIFSDANHETRLRDVNITNPVLDVAPSPLLGVSTSHGSKNVVLCERVQVSGISRLELGSYASSFRVTLSPSVVIPERLHSKIQVCFHRNESLGLCQCEKDEWRSLQKGLWSSVMSPYQKKYVDVKFTGEVSGPVTVTLDEDFQQWRLVCLAIGFALILFAPVVSSWVPFYYSSSMAIGVLLVIIILLFQGMKLLPTGRKNFFYLTIYGSLVGAGSYLFHHFSAVVNSILVNFGLSEEMHNPVSVFLLVAIILAGAALGYWIVRKFVISKDGSVDASVAQFVKWAMRITGTTSILQSTLDTPLAVGALVSCWAVHKLITSQPRKMSQSYTQNGSPWMQQGKQTLRGHSRAEFLSRSSPQGNMWNATSSLSTWPQSPAKGVISPPSSRRQDQKEYYSTYHKTQNRKKFTKKEWDDFTQESTRQALAEWASSPEFTEWFVEHADRIQLLSSECSDEAVGSESDSTDENVVGSGNRFGFLNW
ncbi:hypothetical protein FNV43_RR15156 [Rhamnella rubrinervis]|uniref:Uncharacterized protein n=1 Tax=Rhamnella rubrinervis TaxID=2594499 RepID=A0A8K0E787_9ROSA|nr:hypothetical protein FNV43_RR15156 [Rhamnella rubrinervis]